MKISPPRWADRFLEWYCHPDLLEEIQGDAYELYNRTAKNSKRKADFLFIWNVLRFFRFRNIRKKQKYSSSTINISMLKSYFISGLRNINRQLIHSVINISGLAMAISCCISVFLLVDSFYDLDSFHANKDRLYLAVSEVKTGDETETWARSPYLLGPALIAEQSSVENMVRIQKLGDLSVRHQDQVFNETLWCADSTFFDIFNYPIISGRQNPLNEKHDIVLSRKTAEKYFGTDNAIGKELSIKFDTGQPVLFYVSAVADNMIEKSSMHFTIIIPMSFWEEYRGSEYANWATWARSTFVLMKEGRQPASLATAINEYQKLQNQANEKFQMQGIDWVPIRDVSARSYEIVDSLSWDIHPTTIIVISTIVLFLLVLSCFNYMNVSIASVTLRLKEIGIRKVIGGSKAQVILQYMVENLVLCSIALAAGTALAYLIMVPAFNSLYPINVPFSFSSTQALLIFFGGTLFLIAIISGAYPSLYVSSFNAIYILKGNEKFGRKGFFSKSMLGFQFAISFTTIIFSMLSISNRTYFETKDWGYDHQDIAYFPIHGKDQFQALSNLLSQQSQVVQYAGSASHIGDEDELTSVSSHDKEIQVTRFPVGVDYAQTMNLRLKEGRFFSTASASDKQAAVIVNEVLVKKMGWSEPLNEMLTFHGDKYSVIGVVQNFYYEDFDKKLAPALMHIVPENEFTYFVVKSKPGQIETVTELIRKTWPSIAPDDAYLGKNQGEVFGSFYHNTRSDSKIMYFISMMALILACMGLFGLVSYDLSRRLKEFSVRKIFGADTLTIFKLMSREYWLVILGAFVFGSIIGYYLTAQLHLVVYPDPMPLPQWPLIVTFGLMVISVFLTVATQLYRIVKENPVITLRNE
ncbi:MAG: ABC transporter permease [Cyclobacteriaceae bacterium]|nr:ABC transporter permease [Cyclobacteriaceae bacterium]UYN87250.1 MAG: ABC transporter permease [Cyclobacteriaceae bacterium]